MCMNNTKQRFISVFVFLYYKYLKRLLLCVLDSFNDFETFVLLQKKSDMNKRTGLNYLGNRQGIKIYIAQCTVSRYVSCCSFLCSFLNYLVSINIKNNRHILCPVIDKLKTFCYNPLFSHSKVSR